MAPVPYHMMDYLRCSILFLIFIFIQISATGHTYTLYATAELKLLAPIHYNNKYVSNKCTVGNISN